MKPFSASTDGGLLRSGVKCDGCGEAFKNMASLGNHGRFSKTCTQEMRFWGKVDRSGGPDACWPWIGAITSKHGYGCFNFNRRVLGAHKVAWMLTNGEVAPGLCVLHKCDNRPCCNPGHHFLGTKMENSADARAKDRHSRGERSNRNKLTEDQVRVIRQECGQVTPTRKNIAELAAKYGVHYGTIYCAVTGRTWSHLK